MNELFISVVIPLYNKELTIEDSLKSILGQTRPADEIIVVNDGSTDNSVSVVKQFNNSKITLYSQPNRGVSAARNTGWRMAAGGWIAFLDADDVWKPDFLDQVSQMSMRLMDRGIVVVGTNRINEHGEPWLNPHQLTSGLIEDYFKASETCNRTLLHASAVLVKKQALELIDGFPEGIQFGEDNDTWCRLAWKGPIGFIAEPLIIRHDHAPGNTDRLPYPVGTAYPAPLQSFCRWKKNGLIPQILYKSSRQYIANNTIYYLSQIKNRNASKLTFWRLLLKFAPICMYAPAHFAHLIFDSFPRFKTRINK